VVHVNHQLVYVVVVEIHYTDTGLDTQQVGMAPEWVEQVMLPAVRVVGDFPPLTLPVAGSSD